MYSRNKFQKYPPIVRTRHHYTSWQASALSLAYTWRSFRKTQVHSRDKVSERFLLQALLHRRKLSECVCLLWHVERVWVSIRSFSKQSFRPCTVDRLSTQLYHKFKLSEVTESRLKIDNEVRRLSIFSLLSVTSDSLNLWWGGAYCPRIVSGRGIMSLNAVA